ncbi:MAG: hypothetical protein Q8P67_20795, partial [archaeon]|nr:hypothetical protein [archaeon]
MATPVLSSPLRPAPRPPSGPSSSPAPPPPSMPSPEPSSSSSSSSPSPSRFPARPPPTPPPASPSGEIHRPRPPAPPPPTRQHLPEGHSEDAPDEDEVSFLATLTLTAFKPQQHQQQQQQHHHHHHHQQNQPQEGESNPPSLTDLPSSSSPSSSSPCSIDEQQPRTPTSPIEMRPHGKSSPMLPPRGALRYEPAAALPSPAESGEGEDGLAPPPVAPRKRSVAPALAGTGGGGGGGESKNSEHRRKIVEELVQTERIYLDRMGIIITVYMEPLVQDTKWSVLPAGAVGQLFSNIEA